MKPMQHGEHGGHGKGNGAHYRRLLAMAVLSFASMYILMYAMVDAFDNVFNSLNQFYMAGLMVAPMVIIELVLMWGIYPNRKLNAILLGHGRGRRNRLLDIDPATGCNQRSAVPELDDPAPRWRDPDVPQESSPRSRPAAAVWRDLGVAAIGNRSDEIQAEVTSALLGP
jgi:hypothetical protein